ncbi:hypothetical protein AVEN_12238-1 [Araneus ventricosus]|uniref:Uncharacterized protein n=1 Tax=Araneus ventricosus TaxID=182803 RepID=A0A4Y2T592_ARAVE|nr:hypothetical protein AVEN_12238-1 [Araneus ventricosus]
MVDAENRFQFFLFFIQNKYIVTKVFLWSYGLNSPTRRIMENEGLFTNVNINGQQITNNGNNSTFNRAQITSFPDRTADKTLKSFQWINTTQYRSASNSLLARTADRTPKKFVLQGDPSRSASTPSSKRSLYIVSPGWSRLHMESSSTFKHISSPTRGIEKIPAPLISHISSPKSPSLSPR